MSLDDFQSKTSRSSPEVKQEIRHRIESNQNEPDEAISVKLMSYCSRYGSSTDEGSCSAALCPLDPWIHIRDSWPEADERCNMAKPTRHAYWQSMTEADRKLLPFEGYTKNELVRMNAARQRWNALSDEEKERRRSFLKKGQPARNEDPEEPAQ